MQAKVITDRITIADQPTEEDLDALKREGYVGVINLRRDGEPDQPLSPAAEGELVRALGMDYLHHGVGGTPLSAADVRTVDTFLNAHADGRVLVHCRKGGRAAALVLLYLAAERGWDRAEALAQAAALGLKIENSLRTHVEQFLDSRRG